ncbi:RidA family protein [Neofamilia massiliensis]|uniref:RidA family protein n=1 Tax=Neofamilia massiliensis TaxID=1673724 RepID=UPI00192E4FB7
MIKMKILHTDKAPAAVGPYCQAVQVGDMIFTSGQLAIDPANGNLINDDIEKATRRSLDNVKAILEEAGSSLEKVVKTTIFLDDMDNFARVNEVYGEYFSDHKPARSCIQVARLPKDAIVEIEVIALA